MPRYKTVFQYDLGPAVEAHTQFPSQIYICLVVVLSFKVNLSTTIIIVNQLIVTVRKTLLNLNNQEYSSKTVFWFDLYLIHHLLKNITDY